MRKVAIVIGILLLAGLVSFALVALSPQPPKRPPQVIAPLVQTVVIDAKNGQINVAGNGTVRPRAQINLAPQVSGKVVYVSPSMVSGARVTKGQVLVRIEQADYHNALKQAEAEVAQQQVTLLQEEEEALIAKEEYERFRQREQTRSSLNAYASVDDNDFAAKLIDSGSSSSSASTESNPDEPSSLVLREPQRAAAAAALARAEASLADAELALSRTRITAPFDGYVRTESVDPGQFVSVGQSIAELYASEEVEIMVPLSTDEAALIPSLWEKQANQNDLLIPANVYMDYGGQSYRWDGYVHRAEAALDEMTRTVDVVVRVPNPFNGGDLVTIPGEVDLLSSHVPPLMVGQYTRVEIQGAELKNYYTIPRRALRVDDEIWTIKDDSLIHIVPVQVIQKVEDEVYILSDLDEQTEVVTSDLSAVTEGMKVRPNSQ